MRKRTILTVLCALSMLVCAACGRVPADRDPGGEEVRDAGEGGNEDPSGGAEVREDGGQAVFTYDGVEIPVPGAYRDLLVVETGVPAEDGHGTMLFSCAEKASVEAGEILHPGEEWGDGWLSSICRFDRTGFEGLAAEEGSGIELFARDGQDRYYVRFRPTDVRFLRAGEDGAEGPGEGQDGGLDQWSMLTEWADTLPQTILERNGGLEAYDGSDLTDPDRPYTYDGAHASVIWRGGEDGVSGPVEIVMSQPVRQGEGGIWCVDRIRYHYVDGRTETRLYFPSVSGIHIASDDYWPQVQDECDAGERPEMLDPVGAAAALLHGASWGWPEIEASDLELADPSV